MSARATPLMNPPIPLAAPAALVAGPGLTTPTFAPPPPNSLRMLSIGLGGAAVVDVVGADGTGTAGAAAGGAA